MHRDKQMDASLPGARSSIAKWGVFLVLRQQYRNLWVASVATKYAMHASDNVIMHLSIDGTYNIYSIAYIPLLTQCPFSVSVSPTKQETFH